MSFDEISQQIVKKSVRSAVCIDDAYASAYTPTENLIGLNWEESADLYRRFREDGCCDLDIFQFTSYDDTWGKEHVKYNKDLLILDWELNPLAAGEKYLDSLRIIKDVVESYKIPFILIYTNTEDLHSVGKRLVSSFNEISEKGFDQLCTKCNRQFQGLSDSEEDLDFKNVSNEMFQDFYEYVHFYSRRAELREEIIAKLIESLEVRDECQEKFKNGLFKIFKSQNDNPDEILHLAIAALNDNSDSHTLTRIEINKHAYRINGTIVIIYHKQDKEGGVKPENLFAEFADSIVKNPYSFLNLLSLEFKDKLREDFSIIGTEFSRISEPAFLFHLNNYRDKKTNALDLKYIYDFILKSWVSELYAQKTNEHSNVLEYLAERIENLKSESPRLFDIENANILKELVRYSAFISNTNLRTREDKTLRFGDIFRRENTEEYFLCVTPLCDCVRPKEKINDNFYFVKGIVEQDNQKALRKAESGFYSFIEVDDVPLSIEWKCKPFTSYITRNDITEMTLHYSGKVLELKHVTILKENYVQRISNQSFGYGFRVGVDLPHIEEVLVPDGEACEIEVVPKVVV